MNCTFHKGNTMSFREDPVLRSSPLERNCRHLIEVLEYVAKSRPLYEEEFTLLHEAWVFIDKVLRDSLLEE